MDIIQMLADELQIRKGQAEAAVRLIDEGNTIPFIARYRKEATGSLSDEVLRNLDERLRYLRGALDQLAGRRVLTEPGSYLDTKRLELDRAADRLAMAAERTVSAKKHVFLALAASLEAMSPLKVLSRGFSVATAADGSVVRSADQLREGDRIKLRLADGGAEAEITSAWKG